YNSIPGEYVGRETPFTFVVKPNTGNVITKVSYKVGDTDIELTAEDGGTDTDGYTYTIPAGLTKDARITVVTAQAFDLSKAVIKMYFAGSTKAGTVVSYSKKAAMSEEGIVPTKVEVNDTKGKPLADGEYEILYENNTAAGLAKLVLTAAEGSQVYSGRKEVTFTIKGTNITDAKKVKINVVAPTSWDNSEDGLGNEALIEIYDISGTEPVKLTEAEMSPMGNTAGDYVVKYNGDYDYKDNCVKPGALSVDIVGVGGYEGTKTYKYTVAKPTFNKATETGENDTIKVELTTQSYDFTGRAITPEPVVTYKDKTLVKGKDYVIKKYTNNINSYTLGAGDEGFKAAKAPSILIQGIGYYQGTKTINFKINKVNTGVVLWDSYVADYSYKYTGREIKPKVTVRYCDEECNVLKKYVEKVDYTLEYSNNIEPSIDEAIVKVVPTANGGLTGDPFDVTFSIADAKNNIADAKRFKVQFLKDGVPVDNYSIEYTGEVHEPEIQITEIGGNSDGSDKILDSYTYAYQDKTAAGKAKVTVYGLGNYYGTVTKTYTINKRVVDKATLGKLQVTVGNNDATFYAGEQGKIPEYYYTGYAIKPEIEIFDCALSNWLNEGVDYTISYSNNTNVSTDTKLATATIKFKGTYTGVAADKTNSFVIKYKINSWDLGAADEIVVNNGNNIVYTGKDIKPSVAVTTPNGEAVNPKVLKFVYKNNLNAAASDSDNAPTVRIMPVNKNLTAPKINEKESYVEENFAIEKAELSTSVTVVKIPTQTYKGKALTPKLTLKYNGKVLKEGQDYNCFYSNNTSRGTGWISVTVPENSNYYTEGGYIMFVSFTIK
ncbi:MAG: hypothetical protein KBS96_05900, partial [Lachnospiraceae bacterium]|nr:hypothetical protein [Candidatus Colinaster scatohippi]